MTFLSQLFLLSCIFKTILSIELNLVHLVLTTIERGRMEVRMDKNWPVWVTWRRYQSPGYSWESPHNVSPVQELHTSWLYTGWSSQSRVQCVPRLSRGIWAHGVSQSELPSINEGKKLHWDFHLPCFNSFFSGYNGVNCYERTNLVLSGLQLSY